MMKKLMIVMVVLLMFDISVMAQGKCSEKCNKKRPDMVEMVRIHTDRMVRKYDLDEVQAKKLLDINTEYMGKMKPVVQSKGRGDRNKCSYYADRKAMLSDSLQHLFFPLGKEMLKNPMAYNAELKQLMTREQYAKYESDMDQMRHRGSKKDYKRFSDQERRSKEEK